MNDVANNNSDNNAEGVHPQKHEFAIVINNYVKHLYSLIEIAPFIMELVHAKLLHESMSLRDFVKKNKIEQNQTNSEVTSEEPQLVEAEQVSELTESGAVVNGKEGNDVKNQILNNAKIPEGADTNEPATSTKSSETEDSEPTETEEIAISTDLINEFLHLNDNIGIAIIATKFLPTNFVVAFVSLYDAYLGQLIKTVFLRRPEILNSSDKNILFSELLTFQDIQEAKEYIIEKEVESVLRESHLKHFKWLESKLSMKLREDLPSFPDFIEITERRNLFVHNDGVASRQYIENCKEHKIDVGNIKNGDKLDAKGKYISHCYSILFEIGVKLGHVIWRKLAPEEREDADAHLNSICFDLLKKGHYSLAINLLEFATETIKKHSSLDTTCTFIVNKALAYYLKGKKEDALKIISKQDWSATHDKYQLALAVLKENYAEAAEHMQKIGPHHELIDKAAYREWPLFTKFRTTDEFKTTYKLIFNEEFVFIERTPRDFSKIVETYREYQASQAQKEKEKILNTDNNLN